jgi:Holliday junction resolvase RusA-like endonuclease
MTDTLTRIELWVPGVPASGGSKTAYPSRGGGRKYNIVDAGKNNKQWRNTVAAFAGRDYRGKLLDGPLSVEVVFFMPRPAEHYVGRRRAPGQIKATAPIYHIVKPDATKLWRAAEDALTGILWTDDARIVTQMVTKIYIGSASQEPGMRICVKPIPLENVPSPSL